MAKIKYPAPLGKPSPESVQIAAALQAYRSKDESAYEQAIADHQIELLWKLLEHYRIAPSKPNTWFWLAFKLALDHVPAFQFSDKRTGRPRKNSGLLRIRDLLPKKKGRPKSRKRDELLEDVLNLTIGYCEKYGFKGHGAGKRALDKLLRDYAKDTNRSELRVIAQLPKYQKLLSEAKHKFPEIAAKLPR